MRWLAIVLAFALGFAVTAHELVRRSSKPTAAGQPTITDTKTSKRGAPAKRSSSKRSTATKVKAAPVKSPAGKPAKADSQVATASNAAKVDVPVAKVVGNAAKVDVPVAKVVGNAANVDVPVAKVVGNTAKVDVPVAKTDGNAAKAEAEAEQKSEKKTNEVASSVTSSGTTSFTSSGTTPRAVPAAGTSSNTNTSPDFIDFTATAVGQKLKNNSRLRSKIEATLQAAGYSGTVYEAAYGFENLAELKDALDLVQNHGYEFELLRVQMTGKHVDPKTHLAYRAHQAPDGVKLLGRELATNPVPES